MARIAMRHVEPGERPRPPGSGRARPGGRPLGCASGRRGVPAFQPVTVIEQDPEQHRAVLQVKSREATGQGHANADVTFSLSDGGGTVHTAAQITGKAASMGEGVMVSVLDALIKDFTQKLANL